MQYRFSILLDPFRTDDRNVYLCSWLELVAYTMLATGPGVFPVWLMTFSEMSINTSYGPEQEQRTSRLTSLISMSFSIHTASSAIHRIRLNPDIFDL